MPVPMAWGARNHRIRLCDNWLDVQEKSSLVFLMCDDVIEASSILCTMTTKHENILPDLLTSLNGCEEFIINKFIEALVLIANYKAIKELGCDDTDTNKFIEKYRHAEEEHYIKPVRKALLRMVENMSIKELKRLISLVKQDFVEEDSRFEEFSEEKMEQNLLFWIGQGYISDGVGNESDVTNLVQHLRTMNKHDIARELEKAGKEINSMSNTNVYPNVLYVDNDFIGKSRVMSGVTNITASEGDFYDMDSSNIGLCVIVNQRNFCKKSLFEKGLQITEFRDGTDHDRDMLRITHVGLGYLVVILENQTHEDLENNIKKILCEQVLQSHSSFVLCLLSHGKEDAVYCVDGVAVAVSDIEKWIGGSECPRLLGKPKIIIIQACQGNIHQKVVPVPRDVEDDSVACDGPDQCVPPTADILKFWATPPGYASYRRQTGSIFIQTLCSQLLKRGNNEHVLDIFTSVNELASRTKVNDSVAMPQVTHTIRKKLIYPYVAENKRRAAVLLFEKYLFEELLNNWMIYVALKGHYRRSTNQKNGI